MSTCSTITIINPDMSAMQTTCHWDGYLAFNGVMLQTAYNSPRKASALISHGAISSLGFTSRQSKMEKQVKDLTNFDTFGLAKKLGYDPSKTDKADMDIIDHIDDLMEKVTSPYTFYYGRDRHPADEDCGPQKITSKQLIRSIKSVRKANRMAGYNSDAMFKADPYGIFSDDYSYVYDASIAHPQWFIADVSMGKPKDARDEDGDPCYVYPIHTKLIPLSEAINNDEEASHDVMNIKKAYHDFMKHPIDPSYDEFVGKLEAKYGKHAHAGVAEKHNVKQNIVHQMTLF